MLPINLNKEFSVEIECLPEYASVIGNCMASGDPDFDRECEDEIISQLENGNEWAWCTVHVTVTHLATGAMGEDYLGCCSYKSEKDFIECEYFQDMVSVAIDDCYKNMTDSERYQSLLSVAA